MRCACFLHGSLEHIAGCAAAEARDQVCMCTQRALLLSAVGSGHGSLAANFELEVGLTEVDRRCASIQNVNSIWSGVFGNVRGILLPCCGLAWWPSFTAFETWNADASDSAPSDISGLVRPRCWLAVPNTLPPVSLDRYLENVDAVAKGLSEPISKKQEEKVITCASTRFLFFGKHGYEKNQMNVSVSDGDET